MSFKPTWGPISSVYDIITGSNAYVTGSNGEIKLSVQGSGSYAILQTRRRGQYKAGYQAEFGAGLRIPDYPAQSQVIRAGYFDDEDGFGVGKDSTNLFTFILYMMSFAPLTKYRAYIPHIINEIRSLIRE